MRCRKMTFQSREEFLNADRFGDVTIHARSQTTFLVRFHRMSGHGNDWNMGAADFLLGSDCGGRFETVHLGHLDIHEYHVKLVGLKCGECSPAITGHFHGIASFLKHAHGHGLVNRIVLR